MIHIKNTFFLHLFFGVLVSLFLLPTTTPIYAQVGLETMTVASISLSPKFPTPGQKVEAILRAPTIDMDTALVTWTLNGKVIQKTYSEEKVAFQVGNVGEVYRLSVTAEDGGKTRVTAEETVRVSDMVVVWEGQTYVPPFYEGRALQGPGSSVVCMVIPSIVNEKGQLYNINDLSYIWSVNNDSVPSASGKGLHSVVLANGQPRNAFIINLQVKDPKGIVRAVKKITVPVSQPQVVLYEDSPLIGIRYDSALPQSLGVYGREATIVAEPYFMSAKTRTSPLLKYTWAVDQNEYTNPGNLTFAPSEGTASGSSYLDLVVKNTEQWLQDGHSSLTINFGERNPWGEVGIDNTAL